MDMLSARRAKIVVTIGPATSSRENLEKAIGEKILFIIQHQQGLLDAEISSFDLNGSIIDQTGIDSLGSFRFITSLFEMFYFEKNHKSLTPHNSN